MNKITGQTSPSHPPSAFNQCASKPRVGNIAQFCSAANNSSTDINAPGPRRTLSGDRDTGFKLCYSASVSQVNQIAATEPGPEARNQVYNTTIGKRTTLDHLFTLIRNNRTAHGVNADIQPVYSDFRTGDARHRQADVNKAKNLLGYAPTHRLAQGVAEAMPWYVSNLARSLNSAGASHPVK